MWGSGEGSLRYFTLSGTGKFFVWESGEGALRYFALPDAGKCFVGGSGEGALRYFTFGCAGKCFAWGNGEGSLRYFALPSTGKCFAWKSGEGRVLRVGERLTSQDEIAERGVHNWRHCGFGVEADLQQCWHGHHNQFWKNKRKRSTFYKTSERIDSR